MFPTIFQRKLFPQNQKLIHQIHTTGVTKVLLTQSKIKQAVVHAGHSLQLQHQKALMQLQQENFFNSQSKTLLIAHLATDAMVDGQIMLAITLFQNKMVFSTQKKFILTQQLMELAHMTQAKELVKLPKLLPFLMEMKKNSKIKLYNTELLQSVFLLETPHSCHIQVES